MAVMRDPKPLAYLLAAPRLGRHELRLDRIFYFSVRSRSVMRSCTNALGISRKVYM